MSKPLCKRCHASNFVKHGFIQGRQRYKCRDCGCNFTDTPARGKPPYVRATAILLYSMGMSYAGIARFLNVSNVAVYKWIRTEGVIHQDMASDTKATMVSSDAFIEFLRTKKKSAAKKPPLLLIENEALPGGWIAVHVPPEPGPVAETHENKSKAMPANVSG